MNIPKSIKVGGKIYDVEITSKLDFGNINCSAEVNYSDMIIRICPQAQQKMEGDFLHELVHCIYTHLGYTNHDEKKIEELASALYMVIQDNYDMFLKK